MMSVGPSRSVGAVDVRMLEQPIDDALDVAVPDVDQDVAGM